MCAWLELSKSGFYEWKSRTESVTAKRREVRAASESHHPSGAAPHALIRFLRNQ